MIMQLLFVDPIVTDPSTLAAHLRQSHPEFVQDKHQLQNDLGIKSWQVWIQEGPGNRHYSIQHIACQEPEKFAERFQKAVSSQNSYACWLNQLFFTALSSKHYLANPTSSIDQVLDLDIDPENPAKGFDLCYALPLLPGKVEAHRHYCQSAMNERREPTKLACKAFGMIDMKKWIQQSPEGNFVLYYQRMALPIEKARASFLALRNEPKAQQATKDLRDQTGVAFEELFPALSCISLFE
jgi:hypothetical protein